MESLESLVYVSSAVQAVDDAELLHLLERARVRNTRCEVTGLLLFALAAQPEIQRQLRWRRLHLSANALAALIFITQGITGPRDLLEIPLSWQKPTIWGCNFEQRVCPPFAPAPPQQPPS